MCIRDRLYTATLKYENLNAYNFDCELIIKFNIIYLYQIVITHRYHYHYHHRNRHYHRSLQRLLYKEP